MDVQIDYCPRRWAKRFHAESLRYRWFVFVLHRRAGKTTCILNHHLRAAASDGWETRRIRTLMPDITPDKLREHLRYRLYAHIMPQRDQAKLVAWDMLKYYAGFIPGSTANESELRVDLPITRKGEVRRVRLFGADNLEALRGAALAGISMDEFGQFPPTGFGDILSKGLADHLGYAIWAGTIKGKNQLYKIHEAGKSAADWWTLWQDIDISLATEDDAAIEMLRRAMVDDQALISQGVITQAEYDQEWYLALEAAIRGAYYGEYLTRARKEGRIGRVPFEPALPVDTDWDIGVHDETTIWFSQSLRSGEVRLIDYVHGSDKGFDFYWRRLQELREERGYVYGQHWGPHDIEVREWGGGGKSRKELAASVGLKFEVTPKLGLADGIAATRVFLARCWFDDQRCAHGIEALTQYRKKWNERLQLFEDEPEHGWPSHGADSFRGLAVRHRTPKEKEAQPRRRHQPSFQPVGTGWMGG